MGLEENPTSQNLQNLSVLMYGAFAWQPWLAATRLEQLERCRNRTLCVITGQLQTNPVETLRREAGLCNITTMMSRQTAIAYEKAAKFTPDHPVVELLILQSVTA